ncbi:MAG: isochorismatase family protein [Candidatus Tectomicrobia bacterium]|nr:isochorismatase family protein [Candidatus Tectomicrobia bacterium]
MAKRVWDDFITERDRKVFEAAGYGRQGKLGARPALLIVDVNYNFVGDRPEPILESIKRFRNSCGEEGWVAVGYIRELLEAARAAKAPVLYSTSEGRQTLRDYGRWATKNARAGEVTDTAGHLGVQIVKDIEPKDEDIVIRKQKPSVFFGTPLMSYLTEMEIDTLIVCGTTTSGCVRGTVIDAFSYNLYVGVVEECTFDRGQASHAINLWDMNAKYADVISLQAAKDYFAGLPKR